MKDRTTHPPVGLMATTSLACVIIGGILIASQIPRTPSLTAPTVLAAVAIVIEGAAYLLLSHTTSFNWRAFARVFKWALLAYVVQSSAIEYAFIRNHTPGSAMVVVTASLCVFATAVPLSIAFTVARFATDAT